MVGTSKRPLTYIAAGVKNDFEKLLGRYAQEKSVRYEVFAAIWKELKMNYIFCLRQNDAESREFTEECMKIAQKYVVSTQDLQTRVCALYLLYALYHKQICSPPAQIRVCPWQWQHLLLLLHEARDQKHLDVEYVLQSMLVDHAFTFTATQEVMYPDRQQAFVSDESRAAVAAEEHVTLPERSILSEILQPENIDQLSAIHEQYHMIKCMLEGPTSSQPHESLNVIKPNLVQQLTKLVATHQEKRKILAGRAHKRVRRDSGQTTTSESEVDSDSDSPLSPKRGRHSERLQSTGARRAAIKARAFSQVKVTNRRRRRQAMLEASLSSPESMNSPPPFLEESPPAVLNEITTLPNLCGTMISMPTLTPERTMKGKGRGKGKKKEKTERRRKRNPKEKVLKVALKSQETKRAKKQKGKQDSKSPSKSSPRKKRQMHETSKIDVKQKPDESRKIKDGTESKDKIKLDKLPVKKTSDERQSSAKKETTKSTRKMVKADADKRSKKEKKPGKRKSTLESK